MVSVLMSSHHAPFLQGPAGEQGPRGDRGDKGEKVCGPCQQVLPSVFLGSSRDLIVLWELPGADDSKDALLH